MRALLRRLHAGRSLRLSIAAYLSLGFGGLMLVAVAGVLAMSLYANWRNTSELLFDKSRLILGALTGQIQQYLDPAAAKTDYESGTEVLSIARPPSDAPLTSIAKVLSLLETQWKAQSATSP